MPERDQTENEADAEGLEDLDAGRVVSHAEMKTWLQGWGSAAVGPAEA